MANGIEVKGLDGSWARLSNETAERYLADSRFVRWYDTIETDPGRCTILDLAIPAFLGAPPRFKRLLNLLPEQEDPLRRVSEALRAIPNTVELWDWPDDKTMRNHLTTLFSAARFSYYGPAQITKMLHLKRRLLIPVVDDLVRQAWADTYRRKWTVEELVDIVFDIGHELGQRLGQLNVLMKISQSLGSPWAGLTRLRLYDVVAYQHLFREANRR